MTPLDKSDNDNLDSQLRPAERDILSFAKAHSDMPFCWREFVPKYAHGTIRNALSTLAKLKLLELYCRSTDAYYVYRSANSKQPHKPVTISHMGGRYNTKQLQPDFYDYLESLEWEEISKVHDVVFDFVVSGLYDEVLKTGKHTTIEQSKDVMFETFKWSNNRYLKVILHHTGTVTCYLKCSECPIEVAPEGLVALSAFLGGVHTRLTDLVGAPYSEIDGTVVPDVSDWVITQWHYGKDGKKEISGKSFNVTFKTWSGALVRIYMKKSGKKFRARKEIIEKPRKPLPRAFIEKMTCENGKSAQEPNGSP